jgi:hypothetical protein
MAKETLTKQFFREARLLVFFVGGILSLCVGLGKWKDMTNYHRKIWVVATIGLFVLSFAGWWIGRSKSKFHRRD